MKTAVISLALFFLIANAQAAQVLHVADGDTLTLDTGERIRLAEIDAPELAQPYGHEARARLISLVFTPAGVEVDVVRVDIYGRTLARIRANGYDVGRAMVEAGAAWCAQPYVPKGSPCYPAEARARAARAGLWADPEPVAPWDWRRGVR